MLERNDVNYRVKFCDIQDLEKVLNDMDSEGYEFQDAVLTGNTGTCRVLFHKRNRIETINNALDNAQDVRSEVKKDLYIETQNGLFPWWAYAIMMSVSTILVLWMNHGH